MPPKGRRRPAESGAGAAKEWAHPDGMDLSELDLDAEYEGTITNVGRYGVFVDFGAVKDGLLKVPVNVGRAFKRGMEVKNMVVLSCDPDAGKVVLSPQDETLLPEPAPRQRAQSVPGRGAGRGGVRAALKDGGSSSGRGGQRSSSQPRKARDWSHSAGMSLEEIQVGELSNGVVTNVSPYGVFVDIGTVRDARLSVPAKIGQRFRIGDSITDCKIEHIDVEAERITVSLEDPEEVVKDLPPKEKPKAKAQAKSAQRGRSSSPVSAPAPSRAKAQSRTKKAAPSPPSDIAQLYVGQVVDGVVGNKGQFGIFVDIGVGKDAKLLVPMKMMSRFRRSDEICGMVVETVDVEKNQIAVTLEDPELDDDGYEAPSRGGGAAATKAAAKPKGKAKAQPKANNPNGLPTSKFKVGHTADGVVTNIGPQGVFVDIGAVRDGVLKVPRSLAKEFRVGDEVHGMTIEAADAQSERITLSLEDPELKEDPEGVLRGGPPPRAGSNESSARKASRNSEGGRKVSPTPGPQARSQPKAQSQPKAKPKAKAQAKEGKSWGHPEGTPLEELEVGSACNGVVTNRGAFGVFLNIGAVKDGKLRLERDDWKKFMKGDEVEDMVIESVDIESEQILLCLTYELGDAPDLDAIEAPRTAKAKPRPGTAALPASQAGSRRPAGGPSSRSPGRALATRPATAKAKGGGASRR